MHLSVYLPKMSFSKQSYKEKHIMIFFNPVSTYINYYIRLTVICGPKYCVVTLDPSLQ